MTVLNHKQITDFIKDKKLYITPLININQITNSAIDIRLGTEFLILNKLTTGVFNPLEKIEINEHDISTSIRLKLGEALTLHPNQFLLGISLEYFKLPSNIMGYVIGRSSWGRLGLVIATATLINPLFAGVITLELANLGEIPISLYPGVRIAQVVLHSIDQQIENNEPLQESKYQFSINPEVSKILKDPEWNILQSIKKKDERFSTIHK